jgi:hypothetical protein
MESLVAVANRIQIRITLHLHCASTVCSLQSTAADVRCAAAAEPKPARSALDARLARQKPGAASTWPSFKRNVFVVYLGARMRLRRMSAVCDMLYARKKSAVRQRGMPQGAVVGLGSESEMELVRDQSRPRPSMRSVAQGHRPSAAAMWSEAQGRRAC